MALLGSKLSSWSLVALKVEVNFDSIREAVYKVLKWKKIFSSESPGKFPVRMKKMKVSKYDFPVSFPFFTFSLCVILGPPTIKCQDRIKCPWEKVWRQGWHSCQASVGLTQVKESGREGRQAGRESVLGSSVGRGLAGLPGSSDCLSGGSLCLRVDGPSQNPRTPIIAWEWGPCVRNDGFRMQHLGALG